MSVIAKALLTRPTRLRTNAVLRDLVAEHSLNISDIIMPLFIIAGDNIKQPINSLPGQYQYSLDQLSKEALYLAAQGVHTVILFGVVTDKDSEGSAACSDDGLIQRAIVLLKNICPHWLIIADVCFCEYTSHGHCGVIHNNDVDNDMTLVNIAKQAVSHARAGVDMLAPSGMMDETIRVIREALDNTGFGDLPIMGYSVKYASAFYGPFRDAADSVPAFGDRSTYQIDPANRRESLREAYVDDLEGADILMVKPALSYLDIIRDLKETFDRPIACYNVSGEYSMIKAAAERGWIDGEKVMLESLLSMKRAGADIIITYFAKEVARGLM